MVKRIIVWPMLALILLVSCEGRQEVVSDVNEKEANEIVVFLASQGIPAQKQQVAVTGAGGGADAQPMFTINVPASQVTEAIAILNRAGLPRRTAPSLLSLFAKTGLVSSAQEEQIRYQEGLSEQIAGTIRRIDGVVDAVVQVSFPSNEMGLQEEEAKDQVRASVYVKHTGVLDDPNSQLVSKIKRLVAASVVGLEFDNVTVVTDRARYADVTLMQEERVLPEEERNYTLVWGVVIAQESAGRFRSIFITLCAVILILAAFVLWLLWKTFPAISYGGGFSELFSHTKPIHFEGMPKRKKRRRSEEEEEYYEEEEEDEE